MIPRSPTIWLTLLLQLVIVLDWISTDNLTFTLLHTGKICSKFAPQKGKYGIARAIHYVKEEMAKDPNTVYFDTMDCCFGSFYYDVHRWNICASFLPLFPAEVHSIGEKAMVDGGNENRDKVLAEYLTHLCKRNATIICANCEAHKDARYRPYIKRSHIFKINGRRIGVTAYIGNHLPPDDEIGNMTFEDAAIAVRREVKKFKDDKIRIVILIAHDSFAPSQKFVRLIQDVDIVVAAHSRYFFYNGVPPVDAINERGPYPKVYSDAKEKQVLMVRAGQDLFYVGRLQVTFDMKGGAVAWEGNCVHMDEQIGEDPEAVDLLEVFSEKVHEEEKKVVGTTRVPFPLRCDWRECNAGNLVADAFVWNLIRHPPPPEKIGKGWAIATIAVVHSGSIVEGIALSKLPNNSLREMDVLGLLPSGYSVSIREIWGRVLKSILEHGVDQNIKLGNFFFIQVSGLKVVYDMSRSPGDRVVSIRVRCKECETPRYEDFNPNRKYRVIMPSFISGGSGGFHVPFIDTVYDMADNDASILRNHVAALKTIKIGEEERILVKNCPHCYDREVGSG